MQADYPPHGSRPTNCVQCVGTVAKVLTPLCPACPQWIGFGSSCKRWVRRWLPARGVPRPCAVSAFDSLGRRREQAAIPHDKTCERMANLYIKPEFPVLDRFICFRTRSE